MSWLLRKGGELGLGVHAKRRPDRIWLRAFRILMELKCGSKFMIFRIFRKTGSRFSGKYSRIRSSRFGARVMRKRDAGRIDSLPGIA